MNNIEKYTQGFTDIDPKDFTIFIVDDVMANVLLLKMVLAREGFTIVQTTDPTKVVDMARAAFDAISIPLRAITSSPVIIEVTTPQAACRQAPNDHTPMAMR